MNPLAAAGSRGHTGQVIGLTAHWADVACCRCFVPSTIMGSVCLATLCQGETDAAGSLAVAELSLYLLIYLPTSLSVSRICLALAEKGTYCTTITVIDMLSMGSRRLLIQVTGTRAMGRWVLQHAWAVCRLHAIPDQLLDF